MTADRNQDRQEDHKSLVLQLIDFLLTTTDLKSSAEKNINFLILAKMLECSMFHVLSSNVDHRKLYFDCKLIVVHLQD